jgi:hypothetical protein
MVISGDLVTTSNGWSVASRSSSLLGKRIGQFALYVTCDESGEHLIYSPLLGFVWLASKTKFEIMNRT